MKQNNYNRYKDYIKYAKMRNDEGSYAAALVFIGMAKAYLYEAKTDGEIPQLLYDAEESYDVQPLYREIIRKLSKRS